MIPWRLSGKEPSCQYRRHGFNPWSRKIPHAVGPLSCWAGALEPALCIKRSYCNEHPAHHNEEQSLLATTKKSPCGNEDPGQPKKRGRKRIGWDLDCLEHTQRSEIQCEDTSSPQQGDGFSSVSVFFQSGRVWLGWHSPFIYLVHRTWNNLLMCDLYVFDSVSSSPLLFLEWQLAHEEPVPLCSSLS